MTTAVYFDLDGTLLTSDVPFDALFRRTLPVSASEEMANRYSERVLTGLSAFEPNPYERAFAAVCDDFGVDADPERLAESFVDREVEATRLPPAADRLVRTLADRHRVGILTNGVGRVQRAKVTAHGLGSVVDAVVVSGDVGAHKPDPGVFEAARERLPAEDYLYVGDSYEEDVVGARESGFSPVYVGEERRADAPVSAANPDALAAVLLPLLTGGR